MMIKKYSILLTFMSTPLFIGAQETGRRLNSKDQYFAIEIDPIAYFMNGYSAHGIYEHKKFKFDVGIYGVEQPSFYSVNKDFTTNTIGTGVKASYFLNQSKNWFVGLGLGWTKNKIEYKESSEKQNQETLGLGIHTGLRFFLFKTGLYISPWISLDYNNSLNNLSFKEGDYETSKFTVFPTIHFGYRF